MKIKVTIQGVTPLLMQRFAESNEMRISNPVQLGDRGTPRDQAEKKLYSDTEGNLFIPGPNIFSCIVGAGRFHKLGKSKVTTGKSSLIPAGISVEDIIIPLNTKEWEVDSRSVVIPSTGGRVMCYRPRLDKWKLSFTLAVDDTMFDPRFVRALIDDAGKKCGLGDFRPERKGPFGKFVVINWKESK